MEQVMVQMMDNNNMNNFVKFENDLPFYFRVFVW